MKPLNKQQLKELKTVHLLQMYFEIRHELRIRQEIGDFDEVQNKQKVAMLRL